MLLLLWSCDVSFNIYRARSLNALFERGLIHYSGFLWLLLLLLLMHFVETALSNVLFFRFMWTVAPLNDEWFKSNVILPDFMYMAIDVCNGEQFTKASFSRIWFYSLNFAGFGLPCFVCMHTWRFHEKWSPTTIYSNQQRQQQRNQRPFLGNRSEQSKD